jgi:hypothetical protein
VVTGSGGAGWWRWKTKMLGMVRGAVGGREATWRVHQGRHQLNHIKHDKIRCHNVTIASLFNNK